MGKYGIGVVGYGGYGEFLVQAFSSMPQLKIVAVYDVSSAKRQRAENQLVEINIYADFYALLRDEKVDIVVVSTPPHKNAFFCVAAANANKHIFCKNPLGITMAEADEIIKAVEGSGVRLMLNCVQRYNPINRKLKELYQMDLFGEVGHQSVENYVSSESLKPQHWFWDKSKSGGIWVEHGIHFFDLFSWQSKVRARDGFSIESARIDGCVDKASGVIRYNNGSIGTFTHFFTQPKRFEETTMKVTCTRGYCVLRGWIPLRMKLDVLVSECEYDLLREWAQEYIGDARIIVTYKCDNIAGCESGSPYAIKYRAKVNLQLPQSKEETYQECIRLAMLDLINAICDKDYAQRSTMYDGRESLRTALLMSSCIQ